MKTYSEKLKDPRWQKKRLKVLERDEFTCRICCDDETELQVHHKKYTKEPWQSNMEDLMTLCKHCHTLLETFKKDGLQLIDCHKTEGGNRIYKLMDGSAGIAVVKKDGIEDLVRFDNKSDTLTLLHNICYKYDIIFSPCL